MRRQLPPSCLLVFSIQHLQWFLDEVDLEVRRPFNFVYAHEDGRRIDFHLFKLDSRGNGIYGDTGTIYSAEALSGKGAVLGREVRCINAAAVEFHTGYLHDDDDAHDVRLLCERFGIEVPAQYRRLTGWASP